MPRLPSSLRHRLGAGCLALAVATPLQAAVLSYDIDLPGTGGGSFSFDDGAILWNDPLNHASGGTAPLLDFTLLYDGSLFLLADDPAARAWFWGTPDFFAGIEYLAAFGGDSVTFTAGFGVDPNDLGSFDGFGTESGAIGPIALDSGSFTPASAVPEPETWLASLLALAPGLRRRGAMGASRESPR